MFNSNLIKIIIIILVGVSASVQAGEFAISPLVINIEGKKNTRIPFEFTVKAKKTGDVKIKIFDLNQIETGHMGFIEGDKVNKESKSNWVTLDKTQFSIKQNDFRVAKGYVVIPRKAKGQHLAAVMVEEVQDEEVKNGIKVNVRYAVILKIDTTTGKKSRSRTKTKFEELSFRKVDDGWEFEGYFHNLSKTEGRLFTELQLRNNDKKLVGRVSLKTLSAWQRNEGESMVYPGSRVKIFGKLPKDVIEGGYQVRIKNKFNDSNQPVFRQNIDLVIQDETSFNQAMLTE
jgi:hypothetical protein